ncbi:hydantoinase B/oxoprolinase family protein [Capillimicrobium parvum]|uniref:Acetophenone carboxylase delta subunit n=1 Tax=Capillimicrobium parvum TaxID=2884022 RepID=A0A9E6XVH2_9ACTN|nr:hydantoinase B/oxoprolinase family protein [Capillimicrobium parvum]UGS34521.1 Acetophenone carboxylase delta subunit [Capillimicrobium parvum]
MVSAGGSRTAVDPIAREVIQNRMIAIVREMSVALQRAAYSPIICEVKDFSSVLLRPNGDVMAQAEGIPVFLGSMQQTLAPVLERYPLAEMRPGDVFISNDPYTANGTHKNDINLLKPIFWEGRPVVFAVTKGHWTDIGGKDPGSWSADATNTYQEGVTVPPLRLYHAGERNEELLELLLASVRMRDDNLGDLMAQLSACHVAEVRVHEMLEKYGPALVGACVESLFDYVEAHVRSEIAKVPDGTYTAEDFLDSDGVSDEPVRVVVHVTIDGSDVAFDLTDCDAQRPGSCGNCSRVVAEASLRVAMKCLLGPQLAANQGFYRPMSLTTRPGTITDPIHPAAGTTADNLVRALIEGVFSALAPVLPDQVQAGIFGGVQAMVIAGVDPRHGQPYIHFMPYAGGWGARSSKDGINGLCPILNGDNDNVPVEVTEAKFPLLVERYELIEDSGGPGRFRGGLGIRTDYRVRSEGAMVSCVMSRWRFAPPGLFGGGDGMCSSLVLYADGDRAENSPMLGGRGVERDCLISHRVGGGGGFGDPRERDPERVRSDVREGYVSAAAAERDYGLDADRLRAS